MLNRFWERENESKRWIEGRKNKATFLLSVPSTDEDRLFVAKQPPQIHKLTLSFRPNVRINVCSVYMTVRLPFLSNKKKKQIDKSDGQSNQYRLALLLINNACVGLDNIHVMPVATKKKGESSPTSFHLLLSPALCCCICHLSLCRRREEESRTCPLYHL